MSRKALVPVNVLASATQPTGVHAGDLYFDTGLRALYLFDGSAWIEAASALSVDGGSYNTTTFAVSIDGGSL